MRNSHHGNGKSPVLRRWIQRVPEPRTDEIVSVRLAEIELTEPLPTLFPGPADWAQLLVTLHGLPLGTVQVDLRNGAVRPSELRTIVSAALGDIEGEHLTYDAATEEDDASDWPPMPRCLRELRPDPAAPFASVVVPTRNRAEQLAACLESLLLLEYPAFEVLVVDNAPADETTRHMVAERYGDDPRIRYLRDDRPGASRARNRGTSAARGEIVAFTDDDAIVDRRWLAALVRGFADDPQVMCVAGLTLPTELETPAQVAFELYGGMTCGFRRRMYDLHRHRGDTLLYPYTAGVFGASNNVAFRRQPLLDRGGFDSALGPATPTFGAEDLDSFLAVILGGHRIVYEPRAVVRHEHRRSFSELYWQVFTYSAGFTALLLKWALTDRRVALDLMRRVPRLLPAAFLAAHRSGAEANCGDYPMQIRWLERFGYLYGPVAYARSRIRSRRTMRETDPIATEIRLGV
jgi:GT2 family glycosyltransferase